MSRKKKKVVESVAESAGSAPAHAPDSDSAPLVTTNLRRPPPAPLAARLSAIMATLADARAQADAAKAARAAALAEMDDIAATEGVTRAATAALGALTRTTRTNTRIDPQRLMTALLDAGVDADIIAGCRELATTVTESSSWTFRPTATAGAGAKSESD